jgi:hypothetical protein
MRVAESIQVDLPQGGSRRRSQGFERGDHDRNVETEAAVVHPTKASRGTGYSRLASGMLYN